MNGLKQRHSLSLHYLNESLMALVIEVIEIRRFPLNICSRVCVLIEVPCLNTNILRRRNEESGYQSVLARSQHSTYGTGWMIASTYADETGDNTVEDTNDWGWFECFSS